MLYAIAALFSENGSDNELIFYKNNLKWMNGFEILGFAKHYVATTARCSNFQNYLNTGKDLAMIGKGANKIIAKYIGDYMKDLLGVVDTKEKSAIGQKEKDELKNIKSELNKLLENIK